jgi:hypothetical protein
MGSSITTRVSGVVLATTTSPRLTFFVGDPAVNGRAHGGKFQIEPGGLHRRFGGEHGSVGAAAGCHTGVVILFADRARDDELLAARKFAARIDGVGLGLRQITARLIVCGTEWTRIDNEKRLTLFYILPVVEKDFRYRP